VSGIGGRIFGGTAADSPQWGRKNVLLLAMVISALACAVLAIAQELGTFVMGNLPRRTHVNIYHNLEVLTQLFSVALRKPSVLLPDLR
jgi:MFS family permease